MKAKDLQYDSMGATNKVPLSFYNALVNAFGTVPFTPKQVTILYSEMHRRAYNENDYHQVCMYLSRLANNLRDVSHLVRIARGVYQFKN